jgi:hypothetical protein
MDAATWVIIPTYNEAVNLERIVAAACAELDRVVAGDYRILVVDDGSPDGTGTIADSLALQCCTEPARPGSAPPTWPGSTTRLRPVRNESSRWTPISPTTPVTCRRC